jgi:hypothetical protein
LEAHISRKTSEIWGTQRLLLVWGEVPWGFLLSLVHLDESRVCPPVFGEGAEFKGGYPRGSYHLGACVREGDARNSQEAVFLVGVPVRLFFLERRGSRFSPQGVVPGDRLQSIMAGLKDHRRFSWFALNVVKLDGDLAARIGPMSKGRNGAFAKILCDGGGSVRTEAYAERRPGGPGRVGGVGRFRTVDAGVF